MLKSLIISVRPYQWYKNVLLFVGLVFSHNLSNASAWKAVILAFIYFCAISAGGYLINDILDREKDREHPTKRQRPIASGQLKVSISLSIALTLIAVSLIGAYFTVNFGFFIISLAYLVLTLLYSLRLKHLIIVDVLVISAGFVIRAVAGCLVINVFISPWLIVCTFLLALFLALSKRRHELLILGNRADTYRASLTGYSAQMLEGLISITIGALMVSYFMYTFLTDNYYMMVTTPFVVYGLFRYLFLVYSKNFGGEPEMLFKDKAMLVNLAIWALLTVLVLYKVPAMFWE